MRTSSHALQKFLGNKFLESAIFILCRPPFIVWQFLVTRSLNNQFRASLDLECQKIWIKLQNLNYLKMIDRFQRFLELCKQLLCFCVNWRKILKVIFCLKRFRPILPHKKQCNPDTQDPFRVIARDNVPFFLWSKDPLWKLLWIIPWSLGSSALLNAILNTAKE